jgi:hypothetical protein
VAAVPCRLIEPLLPLAGHQEEGGAVEALDRFLHALSGEHAPVVLRQDALGALAQLRDLEHRDQRHGGERDPQRHLRQE